MDPSTTLRQLEAALYKKDYDEAAEMATDLQLWLVAGGFVPSDEADAVRWAVVLGALADLVLAAAEGD